MISSIIDVGITLIDKLFPDKDKAELEKQKLRNLNDAAAIAAKVKELEAIYELALQTDKNQTTINKAEAKRDSLFIAGWRPFIGWICGIAVAFNFLLTPIINQLLTVLYNYGSIEKLTLITSLDMSELWTVLLGMLGLGGLRTYEKLKHVARKRL